MTAFPAAPPVLGFSFTSFSTNNPTAQPPGGSIDAEFNQGYTFDAAVLAAIAVSHNADGTLKSSAVTAALAAATTPAGGGNPVNLADAPSALSAALSQDWAEYMPGPLPAASLAGTEITGDHYSSRWWANQAATFFVARSLGQSFLTGSPGVLTSDGVGGFTWKPNPLPPSASISPKTYGAIGDGASHPLSSVTNYAGQATNGFTLAQWQAVFPFADSLANELDQCALIKAIQAAAAAGVSLRVPGGRYQCNMTTTVALPAGQTCAISGDGPGLTRFEVTGNASFLKLTVGTSSDVGGWCEFSDFSFYQKTPATAGASGVIGTGLSVTGVSSTTGRQFVFFTNVSAGDPSLNGQSTVGAFSIAVDLLDITQSWFTQCNFSGTQLGGIGVRSNGNSTFYTFGPNFNFCNFDNLDRAVLIGDGTNAYVQGVVLNGCTLNYSNYFVYWAGGLNTIADNDGLLVTNCNIAAVIAGIYTVNVLTHTITGNYFLGQTNISVSWPASGSAGDVNISANSFVGYGQANRIGVEVGAITGQAAVSIDANLFFDFNGTGAVPIKLDAGTYAVLVSGNSLVDCNLPVDNGTATIWLMNTYRSADAGGTEIFANGMPYVPDAGTGAMVFQNGVFFRNASDMLLTMNRASGSPVISSLVARMGYIASTQSVEIQRYLPDVNNAPQFKAALKFSASGVTLGSSEGPTQITNNLVIGFGADIPPTQNGPFLQVTVMTAPPTSAASNGAVALDRNAGKLWLYCNGVWKGVVLS